MSLLAPRCITAPPAGTTKGSSAAPPQVQASSGSSGLGRAQNTAQASQGQWLQPRTGNTAMSQQRWPRSADKNSKDMSQPSAKQGLSVLHT